MNYLAYPKYKPSGVEWLDRVPEHWKIKRGRFLMQVNPASIRLRELDDEDEVSFVTMDAVGEYGGLRLDETRPIGEVRTGYVEFDDGDVIVAKITPCFENGKGALASGLKNGAALGTTELHVLRSKGTILQEFLFYHTVSSAFRRNGEAEMYGAGGQKRVPPDFCKDYPYALPHPDEQAKIVSFLDKQTAKFDTLILKKQALIERLKERRLSLISQVVTRGLPPYAARAAGLNAHPNLKPSGIDWLGDVPEQWEVAQLRRHTTFITSGSRGWAEHYSVEGEKFIRIGNLTRDSIRVDLTDLQFVDPPETAEGKRTRIQLGDILFSITAYIGSVAVAHEPIMGGYVNQHIALVRLDQRKLSPEFTGFCGLSSFGQAQLGVQGYGGTKTQLALNDVLSLWLPVPPKHEQLLIARFLEAEVKSFDELISKVSSARDRLTEYRATIISAAVTGKIDVRGTPA